MFDLTIVVFSYFFAVWIRLDFSFRQLNHYQTMVGFIPFMLLVYYVVFKLFKTDKTLWSNPGVTEALRIAYAALVGAIIFGWFVIFLQQSNYLLSFFNLTKFWPALFGFELVESTLSYSSTLKPVVIALARSTFLIALLVIILVMTFIRFTYRIYRLYVMRFSHHQTNQRALIIGAGQAGKLLLDEFVRNPQYAPYDVVGFVDDDSNKVNKYFSGYRILGKTSQLIELVKDHRIDVIFVALPSASIKRQKEIIQLAYQSKAKVFTLRGSTELLSETGLSKNIQQIDIIDLLGRKEIKLDNQNISDLIFNKVVLITGAAGSIGSELSKQILSYQPKQCILVDINENALFDLKHQLQNQYQDFQNSNNHMLFYTISIQDKPALDTLFKKHNIQLVFHAAAFKHVPFMEDAPGQAIRNNIFGSYNLFSIAHQHQVELVVAVSTDKAINPTNVMGATKRFVEMMSQAFGSVSKTKFVSVRFGNVLGSNGSVIPLFKKQIEAGGPVTVTHKDMVRYFMLIPEAVSLILQAATFGHKNEIYILDMGEPVSILGLAENMITLAGYKPYEEVGITFTGLRPGEKLFEELFTQDEAVKETPNNLIYIVQSDTYPLEEITQILKDFTKILDTGSDKAELINALQSAIPTYRNGDYP